jgi:hypothetical protein
MLKTFTFFFNRYDTATTSRALAENGIPHYVMIHNEEDRKKFEAGGVLHGTPVVTNNPKGLAYQRNSALELVEDGEWCVFMCDDFQEVKAFNWDRFRKDDQVTFDRTTNEYNRQGRYTDRPTLAQLYEQFPYLIRMAERLGIHLIAFAFNANPRNVLRKFSFKGLCDGRFWIIKKSHLRFDLNAQLIDDVSWTVLNLQAWGNNLIVNWIDPEFERYSAGGFGSIGERIEQRRIEAKYLVDNFYPMIRYADKPGWPAKTHIKIHA